MKHRKIYILFLIGFVLLFLSGCRKLDVSDYTTVIAMGIDKSEKGVKVSVQAVNDFVLGSKPSQSSPVVVFAEEAASIYEAFVKLSNYSVNKLYIFHIQCLIIGSELAQEGIEKHIKFFVFHWETQHNFNIVVAQDEKAEDILKMRSVLENIPAVA